MSVEKRNGYNAVKTSGLSNLEVIDLSKVNLVYLSIGFL